MKEKPYKFVVRLPTSMRDRIAESAQLYRRSMNSEIVARLQESFSGLGGNHQHTDQVAEQRPDLLASQSPNPESNKQVNGQSHRHATFHANNSANNSPNNLSSRPGSGLNVHLERILRQQLDPDEEQILQGYRQLGKAKRDALLKLLSD